MNRHSDRDIFDGDADFPTEEDLVAHLFGDADDPAAIEAALADSPELRRTFDELRQTLALVDGEPVPERADDYGAEVFSSIADRLAAADRSSEDPGEGSPGSVLAFPPRSTPPRWLGLAAAALVLLAVGFGLGRLGTVPVSGPAGQVADAAALSAEARERLLATALTRHLGQSERLLTDFVNASDAGASGDELERVWAAELLASNRLYRRAAEAAGQRRIARLLAELEPVLLELAHLRASDVPEQPDGEAEALRRRVDERGLLFKVRVTERRLDGGQRL
ncbi:MAG: hypothetical protein AAGM22_21705 [Acidobacteriota bacterium]